MRQTYVDFKLYFLTLKFFQHMKKYIALDFKSGMSKHDLYGFAANVLSRMSDNTNYGSLKGLLESELQPTLVQYATALQEAADGGHSKVAVLRTQAKKLIDTLETVAAHVVVQAGDSESFILESGFTVRKRQRSDGLTLPGQVTGLEVKAISTGQVLLQFKSVPGSITYGIEWSYDEGQTWQNGVFTTSRKAIVSGLPSQKVVWFRVFAIASMQRKGLPSAPVPYFVQ